MKYLLFVLLLVALIITAGCTSGNQNTVVTPTQTTAQVPTTPLTTTVIPTPTHSFIMPSTPEGVTSDNIDRVMMNCINTTNVGGKYWGYSTSPVCVKAYDLYESINKPDLTKTSYCTYWGNSHLIYCNETLQNSIEKQSSNSATSGTAANAAIQKYSLEGDYCGPMVQVGNDKTMCMHFSSFGSGPVEFWIQHNRGVTSAHSSYTQNNNRIIINLPNGWEWTGYSAGKGTVTSKTAECVFNDYEGSLSCSGKTYWRAVAYQL